MHDRPWKILSSWLNDPEAKEYQKRLLEHFEWEQPTVNVYGKDYLVPRKTIFIGDHELIYSYSGVTHKAKDWPYWFYPLLKKICFTCESDFNGCLLNLYRTGNDRMGWHSDNEKELKADEPIASLSLGATRDFYIKHRNLPDKEIICLHHGDLLIMHPPCQDEWLHSIPVRKRVKESRINLTFRCYK